jgi:predicted  nucleic acid-binding Zn-ribbon protein
MLNRFLTGLFTGTRGLWKELRVLHDWHDSQEKDIQKAIAAANSEIETLKDLLTELKSEHRKLRGRFYAARGELEPEGSAPNQSREQMKREAYAKIGYIPGRPPPHKG